MNPDTTPPDTTPTPTGTTLPDAVKAYLRSCAAAGGRARAARMTPEERRASAQLAARAPRRRRTKA